MADFDALTGEGASATSRDELLGAGKAQLHKSFKEKFLIEMSRYKLLFKGWPMIRLTILVWLTYICDFWGFTLAGTFLPQILALKNGSISLSLKFSYRSYMAIYTPGIVAVVAGAMMYRVPKIGRQLTMIISSALMGVSIFVFSAVNDEASNIGLNMMEVGIAE